MSDCPRQGKLFGGCKFSPRYDEVSAVDPMQVGLWYTAAKYPQPQPARKTYLCDVCERCGKTLFRRKQQPRSQG